MKADIERVLAAPGEFLADPIYAALAKALKHMDSRALRDQPREQGVPYRTWGSDIDEGAHEQMRNACRLPVSVAGALMPDAHLGYGLPIGGVLATEGAVIPFAVGVDIACRMRLSVYPVSPIVIGQKSGQFKKALNEQTRFGIGSGGEWRHNEQAEHEVLDDPDWN